jgi:(1->4)-alpha-D-glucan 1-alpha-D-glucosylmutase
MTGARSARIPRATYRLQFHAGFGFDDACAILPYLQRLGVSHVYASPLLGARPGSTHGYDVTDWTRINPELGGMPGFERFSDALQAHGLGLLLDIVPNHMGIGADNAWWMDVLEHGEASAQARWFDIDWTRGRLVLPTLGRRLAGALADGELSVALDDDGRFSLRYFDHRFALDPATLAPVLARAAALCGSAGQATLEALAADHAALPPREPAAAPRRAEAAAALRERLRSAAAGSDEVHAALVGALAEVNTPARLAALHDAQAWRLTSWRDASDEINYRRFFDVNELAALRMEEPDVFEATHALVLDLASAGRVDGLRIDHPDGLRDPADYFERLQAAYARRVGAGVPGVLPLYVVAEKIEAEGEELPDWALHGTTGYRFANEVNGVLVDPSAQPRFDRLWRRYGDGDRDFQAHARRGKREVIQRAFRGELEALTDALAAIARETPETRDFPRAALRDALASIASLLPAYRTYIVDRASPQDDRLIGLAVAEAGAQRPRLDAEVLAFTQKALSGRPASADEASRARGLALAQRFQQFTAPVAAKGVEDTAFYRYHRFVPLDEVGGEPGRFGVARTAFHAANAQRAARWPHGLLATSTHDNKRSEDVRCRLDVLSERPGAWRLLLARMERAAAGWQAEGATLPAPADRYLLLQTVLGVLPPGGVDADEATLVDRISQYALKAAREAKQHTSWTDVDTAYEAALQDFVARMMASPLRDEWQRDADALAWFGGFNSTAMTALKLMAPGVPDIYQGNELIDLSLVDPDNRRPVDYASRAALLEELDALAASADWRPALREFASTPYDGRLKLWTTTTLLQHRARHEALLRDGHYAALRATGERERHAVAFERSLDGRTLIVVVARWIAQLLGGQAQWPPGGAAWGDTRLELPHLEPGVALHNVLTGEVAHVGDGSVSIARLFETLPLAVLEVEAR